jgi:NAD(P)H-hydrate epimerase
MNRFDAVRKFAAEYNVNVVLKSETSISCLVSGEIFINSSGNESLASAGTGDVLSGITASVFARTGNAKTAMICGNYIHGYSADLYYQKTGNKQSASPQDIMKLIPKAVSEILHDN